MCFHLTQGTSVYNVEDDVAGSKRQARGRGGEGGGGGSGGEGTGGEGASGTDVDSAHEGRKPRQPRHSTGGGAPAPEAPNYLTLNKLEVGASIPPGASTRSLFGLT